MVEIETQYNYYNLLIAFTLWLWMIRNTKKCRLTYCVKSINTQLLSCTGVTCNNDCWILEWCDASI